MNRWYQIKAKADDSVDVYIMGEIGGFWDGIQAEEFVESFNEIKKTAKTINVFVNSPGGDVFDGMAIYNVIKTVQDKVTVYVMGLAASMASIIMLAGSRRVMYSGTYVMIHNPSTVVLGNSEDLRKSAELLDGITEQMVDIYASRTGVDPESVRMMMAAETWLTAGEAVAKGFADGLDETQAAASICVDKAIKDRFRNAPTAIAEAQPTIRDAERALRDAGFSAKEAKRLLGKRNVAQRDVDADYSQVGSLVNDMIDMLNEVKV